MSAEKVNTDTAAPAEKKPEAGAKAPQEKQTNCLACGKPIKRLKRYYRNGKFYCNKKCWKKSLESKDKEAQKP